MDLVLISVVCLLSLFSGVSIGAVAILASRKAD